MGQACTHSPQATQVESPIGSSKSNTGFAVDVAEGHADHVIDLDFTAGAHAEPTVDAGVEIDSHGGMRQVGPQDAVGGEAGGVDALSLGPVPEFGDAVGGVLSRRLVREQKLHDHAARLHGAIGRGLHHHVGCGLADAGRCQSALALDLDHTGAAIAISAIAGFRQPAQMRDVDALALSHLPNGFAGPGAHNLAVDGEEQLVCHDLIVSLSSIDPARRPRPCGRVYA